MASDLIPLWALDLRDRLMDLWDGWGIQTLVIGSLFFQVILTLFGRRRKHMTGLIGHGMRCFLWSIYLMATVVVPYSLGKLTGLRFNPKHPDPGVELNALLAPLLLLQLGYPDSLTAYSMEDNQLGLRQVLNMSIIVMVVVGILIRCWNHTNFAILYFPMFLAGIIKYAEGIWALKFSLSLNTGITAKEIASKRTVHPFLDALPKIDGLELVVKAYYRFHCLKPHLEDWIYNPRYISDAQLSIDDCSHQKAFRITEIELGFMYDMLYTKGPVIYTKLGLFVRFASFFWLIVTLCAFNTLAKSINPPPANITYQYKRFTFFVLMLALFLEAYQILLLPYSEWAIAKMSKRYNWPLVPTFLRIFAPKSVHKWRQWSDSLYQFNLLRYCLRRDWTRHIKFLNFWGIYEYIKWNWSLNRMGPVSLPENLKKGVWEELKVFEEVRGTRPFSKRGEWSFTRYNASDEIWRSIETAFDKSILVWHIATDICYHHHMDDNESSERQRHSNNDESPDCLSRSKLISDYMMYLLVIRPKMLSTTTASIVFRHTYRRVKEIRKKSASITKEPELARIILDDGQSSRSSSPGQDHDALVTSGWDVISDAQRLARNLQARPDRWKLMNSVWMEMLCYAGANCRSSYHAEQVRRGGELITLVWLLLAHKTDTLNL